MNKKKSIAVAIVLALLLFIGGMLAYFTDIDTKTNVFTVGKIDISLNEPNWDAEDAKDIIPGATIDKDPTVKNESKTNSAYVFVTVTVPAKDASTPFFTYSKNSAWTEIGTEKYADGKITHVYAYGSNSAMTELETEVSTAAVFNKVTFLSTLTAADLGTVTSLDIVVNAYGIQTDGVSSVPETLWDLVKGECSVNI